MFIFSQNVCKVFDLNGKCVMIGLRTSTNCYEVCQDSFNSSFFHVCCSSKIESIYLWKSVVESCIVVVDTNPKENEDVDILMPINQLQIEEYLEDETNDVKKEENDENWMILIGGELNQLMLIGGN